LSPAALDLKTRVFAGKSEVESLVDAFEIATVSAAEFTHAAHIAVALYYLDPMPAEAPPGPRAPF